MYQNQSPKDEDVILAGAMCYYVVGVFLQYLCAVSVMIASLDFEDDLCPDAVTVIILVVDPEEFLSFVPPLLP